MILGNCRSTAERRADNRSGMILARGFRLRWLSPLAKTLTWKVVCCILLQSSAYAAETIQDETLGFELSAPEGFRSLPDSEHDMPESIAHVLVRGELDDDEPDLLILVEDMGSPIAQEPIDKTILPQHVSGPFDVRWQGFQLDALEVPEEVEGQRFITFNIQVPLRPHAIQLRLFGPAERRDELFALMPQVLAGLKGESNWSPLSMKGNFTESQYRIVLLIIACAIVSVGVISFWRISKVAPRGTVLGLAIVTWWVGRTLAESQLREQVLVGGSLQLLGTCGFILGLIDLVRRRGEKQPQTGHPAEIPADRL